MKQILILTTISILLAGCGRSGESSSNTNYQGSEESGKMVIDKIYTMHPGDSVKKISDNPIIQITHINHSESSNIVLLSGEATISRVN
jgi:hypothetical protein